MNIDLLLQNFYMVEEVKEKDISQIILPSTVRNDASTAFVRVLKVHEPYNRNGQENKPQVEAGSIAMIFRSIEGNVTFEQDGREVFLVPDSAFIAVVSDLDLEEDTDEGSETVSE